MIKRCYYGLTHGEYLGYNIGRKEKYFYCIFADGSETVEIERENGERYHFGSIKHCKKMFRLGYSFTNEKYYNYELTENFKNALCA